MRAMVRIEAGQAAQIVARHRSLEVSPEDARLARGRAGMFEHAAGNVH